MPSIYNDNNQVNAPKNIDNKKGKFSGGAWRAYNDIAEANATVLQAYRSKGQEVYVLKEGILTEYWWRDGVTDEDLIEKTSSGEITIDPTPTNGSDNAVASNGVFDALATKQDTLVSGTNIKTINGTTVLGSGDITISGGTIDAVPTDGSSNAVSSNGTFDALALKAPLASPTFTGTVVLPSTTSIGNVSSTEIGYVDGVTSSIQTQLDNKQPLDSDLTTIAGLTATTDNFIVSVSSAWASRTPAQVKTTLVLDNVDNTSDATKNAATVTLTNKTISGSSNTLSNIAQSSVTSLTSDLAAKQATLTDVNFGSFSNGLTAKTTPVDADTVNIVDSADSNKAKKLTLLNMVAYIIGAARSVAATWTFQSVYASLATNPIFRLTTATHNWDIQHTTTGQYLDSNYDGSTKVRTNTSGQTGFGSTTLNAWVNTAACTASVPNLYLAPGVAYTGSADGAEWYESNGTTTTRKRVYTGAVANDVLFAYNNYLLKGTGNRMMEVNQDGDVSSANEIIEQFVTDSDVITAITGATYTTDRATITPASSKIFKAGQMYDSGTYTYLALADNSVRRW